MNKVNVQTQIHPSSAGVVPKEAPLVQSIDTRDPDAIKAGISMKKTIFAVYIVLIVLGVGTGYLLSRGTGSSKNAPVTGSMLTTGSAVGISDETTFKDSAEGTIEAGGADGEGTHKLIRDGGPSQTVYLISSVVDLDEFIGKKVKVWGQTQAAKSVAWLMDVGKVELK